MVKWFVSVSASIAERMSGISSNPADDFALAKIEKKETCLFREKILFFNSKVKGTVQFELLR